MFRRLLLAVTVAAAAPAPAADPHPAGRAVLAFDLPPDATLTVDGADHTGRPEVAVDCQPGRLTARRAVVTLADGTAVTKDLLVRAGWRVRVPAPGPAGGRPDLVAQSGHSDAVFAAAFTPDGRYLLTGSADRTAVLWETHTGRQVRTYGGNPNMVMGVAVSPDGARAAVAVGRHQTFIEPVGEAGVYDLATGARALRVAAGGPVQAVAFTPDGRHLVLGRWDGQVTVVDLARKEVVRTFRAHDQPVWAVAPDPAGGGVVTGGLDGTAAIWDPVAGRLVRRLQGRGGSVYAVAVAAGGQVLTGSGDGTAHLWDRQTGTTNVEFRGHSGPVFAAALNPAGDRVLTAGADGTARVWDAATGKQVHALKKQTGPALAAAFHPRGFAATAGWDKDGYLWRPADGAVVAEYKSRVDRPWGHAVSPDGARVVGGVGDSSAVVWAPAGDLPVRPLGGHSGVVRAVHFDRAGGRFITGSDDRTAKVWDAATMTPVATLPASDNPAAGHADIVMPARLSPDGRTAVTGTRATRKPVGPADQQRVAFDPPGWGYLWDAGTGKLLRRVGEGRGSVWDAEFTPDGKHLVTVDGDESEGGTTAPGRAVLWDVASGRKVRTLAELPGPGTGVTVSPDGARVLVCGKDKSAVLVDLATGRKGRAFGGFAQPVSGAYWTPDGAYLLLASFDGTVRLVDADTGRAVRVVAGHTGPVDVLVLLPDGRHFLSGGGDGVLRYWDLATGDQVAWMVTLNAGRDWLAATPDGLFDGTPAGRDNVRFRVGGRLDVPDADRFFKNFYRPGLLRQVWAGDRPRPPAALGGKPAPGVKILTPRPAGPVAADTFPVEVELTDTGGGVGKVTVRVRGNDYLLRPTAAAPAAGGRGEVRTYQVPLAPGRNEVAVHAEAAAPGAPDSDPARLVVTRDAPPPPPRLHLVAVGVGECADPAVPRLQFPAEDVAAVGRLFARQAGKGKLFAEVVPAALVDQAATRAAVLAAVDRAAKAAAPTDTLVVYLSGHGDQKAGGGFLFLTHDAAKADLGRTALPGADLLERVKRVPAGQKVVILDTCHSGGVVADLFRKEAEAAGRHSGLILLTAAAPDKPAVEARRLRHGVLTYCLLRAAGAVQTVPIGRVALALPALTGSPIKATEWCSNARDKVAELMDAARLPDVFPHAVFTGRNFPLLGGPGDNP